MEIVFKKERETKNTIRYAEEGDIPQIGTLYIQKFAAAQAGLKDKIKVIIKPID